MHPAVVIFYNKSKKTVLNLKKKHRNIESKSLKSDIMASRITLLIQLLAGFLINITIIGFQSKYNQTNQSTPTI